MPRRLSLRARLVLGVIVLAAAGLAAANVATYAALRSFLLERTDDALTEFARSLEGPLDHGQCPGDRDRGPYFAGDPGDYIEVRGSGGRLLCEPAQVTLFGEPAPAPPDLPPTVEVDQGDGGGAALARYFTASSADGERYRVRASLVDDFDATLIVATPLADVDATLDRLLLVMLLVTVVVLIALAVLGLWVVRLGLLPLTAIEGTAGAIAAGDLSRRVERAEPDTEVGRLGIALNTMLGRIESRRH